MSRLSELLGRGQPLAEHRPWPGAQVTATLWSEAAAALAAGALGLLGLWGDEGTVLMALLDEGTASGAGAEPAIGVLRLDCPQSTFPSVAAWFPPAGRLERTVSDLFGLQAEDASDDRPWLDHGRWGRTAPLAGGPQPRPAPIAPANAYRFRSAHGESLHQIPVGPVHAGIIEPGHFRFTAAGETVVRLEERLGYVHKGVESLLRGADLPRAARLAGRVSGDSTVAYALAFARAAEAALDWQPPPRAVWLRALMAELERVANHIGDIGAICNDAAFALMHAHCAVLREEVLRCADTCFGHRLMMDRIVPGGVTHDLDGSHRERLADLLRRFGNRFPALVDLYDTAASLKERMVGTGLLRPELAGRFGCGGFVGRASGRALDARRTPGYAPYDRLDFEVPVLHAGDVNARVWIRIREIEQSLGLIERLLDGLPAGPIAADAPARSGGKPLQGMALVEGFRGDVLAWLRLGPEGRIQRCHLRDPSWFQWPLLEAAIEGNIVADFPLCNKSFNCSYSGQDL